MKVNSQYTPRDAWEAFRDRQYELACHIWITLMAQAQSLDSHRSYQLNYTHVLVAQGRYQEASAILSELHETDSKPIYLHQLAFVAREAGDLEQARVCLYQEKQLIGADKHLLLAGNEYELGIVSWLEGNLDTALRHARASLEYAQLANDLTAEGCVHRLLGDLLTASSDLAAAEANYLAAQQAFVVTGDSLAAKEIGRQLQNQIGVAPPQKGHDGAEQE